jgi:RNA polymerase sigma factor (sigma-70 family)
MNAIDPARGRRSLEIPIIPNAPSTPSAELMVTLLAPMLARIALRYEPDEQRRGDLQQEMLIKIWISLSTQEESASFPAWVNRVAHQVGMRHVSERRSNRRSEQLSDNLETLVTPRDPESILATRERALAVLSLLGGLRGREREVVLLYLQDFELDEMSHAMKICRTQVRETLIRARRRLLKRIKKTEFRGSSAWDLSRKELQQTEPLLPERRPRRSRDRSDVYRIEPLAKEMPNGCA